MTKFDAIMLQSGAGRFFVRRWLLLPALVLLLGGCVGGGRAQNRAVNISTDRMPAFATLGGSGLVRQSTSGYQRVCTYRGNSIGTEELTLRVGLGDRCPLTYRIGGRASLPPPTAGLVSEALEAGIRSCVYEALNTQWTIEVADEFACPMNAGMARQLSAPPVERR